MVTSVCGQAAVVAGGDEDVELVRVRNVGGRVDGVAVLLRDHRVVAERVDLEAGRHHDADGDLAVVADPERVERCVRRVDSPRVLRAWWQAGDVVGDVDLCALLGRRGSSRDRCRDVEVGVAVDQPGGQAQRSAAGGGGHLVDGAHRHRQREAGEVAAVDVVAVALVGDGVGERDLGQHVHHAGHGVDRVGGGAAERQARRRRALACGAPASTASGKRHEKREERESEPPSHRASLFRCRSPSRRGRRPWSVAWRD